MYFENKISCSLTTVLYRLFRFLHHYPPSGRFLYFGQLTLLCCTCTMSQILTIISLNFNEMITTVLLMYVCLTYIV